MQGSLLLVRRVYLNSRIKLRLGVTEMWESPST